MKLRRKTLDRVLSSVVNNITLDGEEKTKIKKKRNYSNTGYSCLVTQPSENPAEQGLTIRIRRFAVLSLWCNDSTLNTVLYFYYLSED